MVANVVLPKNSILNSRLELETERKKCSHLCIKMKMKGKKLPFSSQKLKYTSCHALPQLVQAFFKSANFFSIIIPNLNGFLLQTSTALLFR